MAMSRAGGHKSSAKYDFEYNFDYSYDHDTEYPYLDNPSQATTPEESGFYSSQRTTPVESDFYSSQITTPVNGELYYPYNNSTSGKNGSYFPQKSTVGKSESYFPQKTVTSKNESYFFPNDTSWKSDLYYPQRSNPKRDDLYSFEGTTPTTNYPFYSQTIHQLKSNHKFQRLRLHSNEDDDDYDDEDEFKDYKPQGKQNLLGSEADDLSIGKNRSQSVGRRTERYLDENAINKSVIEGKNALLKERIKNDNEHQFAVLTKRDTAFERNCQSLPAQFQKDLMKQDPLLGIEVQGRMCSLVILILILIIGIFIVITAIILYSNHAPLEKAKESVTDQIDMCEGILCYYGSCAQGKCTCPDDCKSDQPICGNDGSTYKSLCHLQRHACTSANNTSFLHYGPCIIPKDPCEDHKCNIGEQCIVSSEGEAECQCLPQCPSDDDGVGPVCGSDGTDYSSQCELSRTACYTQKKIHVRYAGMCDPCGHVVCGSGQKCLVDDARVPKCQCNSTCPESLSPVCASNGITYSNECNMNFEACTSRQVLTVMFTGECSTGMNPCRAVKCSPRQRCLVNQYGVATCQCQRWCPPILRPVCGSDGVTYDSLCHLEKDLCLSQRDVQISFVGSCGSGGPCKDHNCSRGSICVEKYGQAECECLECGGEYEPVCSIDHVTHNSICHLKRDHCLINSKVDILYEGTCDACKGVHCGEFGVCEIDLHGIARCSCHTNCSQALGGQVCGSDGNTYASECHLRMKSCSSHTPIKVLLKGNCDACMDVHCKYGARCENGRCICPTDCPVKREPVCGSDHVTYGNECIMRKVACEKNEDLSYLFFGECDEIGGIVTDVIFPSPLPAPINPEDPCHNHKCIADAKCHSEVDGHPQCVCDFFCSPPPRYEPICGSDLEFYESECLMRLHACNIQVHLYVVSVEDCANSQRSKGCNDTSPPLINPSTGEDLNCGEGETICPPGTFCHRHKQLAKCCRDHSVRIAVIEAPVPENCDQSEFGCCADGINFAKGPQSEGCPERCRCHSLGAVNEFCDSVTGLCECRVGVGGSNCDRCLPSYYGLHKISEGAIGCTPCGCSRFGSLRSDCRQMTGECICKPGVYGHRCTECPKGKILKPDGCIYDDALVPQPTSCDLLHCHMGGICQEQSSMASCLCINHCMEIKMTKDSVVCGSDGVTYFSKCELDYQACVQQADIVTVALGSCSELWTDSPIRRSTTDDGWYTSEWAVTSYGQTEQHALATRRHLEMTNYSSHEINRFKISPPSQLTSSPLVSEDVFISAPTPIVPYEIPAFLGESYLHLMPWLVPSKALLEIEFIAHDLNGVLLYVHQNTEDNNGDFLALVLADGHLELRLNMGNGPVFLRLTSPVKLYVKTSATIRTYNRDILLQMGKGESVSGRSGGIHRSLDIYAPLFVGGVPLLASQIQGNVGVHKGFTGCIHSLKVGKHIIDLVEGRSGSVSKAYNVNDCRPSPCDASPCFNGGTCHAHPLSASFSCHCSKAYAGHRCEISVSEGCDTLQCPPETTCQTIPGSITVHCIPDPSLLDYNPEEPWPVADLRNNGYLTLPRPDIDSDLLTLELWFLTRSPNGMLLYGGESSGPNGHGGDFISLNLADGYVHFRFQFGIGGVVNLTSNTWITENIWHRLIATWEVDKASLRVNDELPVSCDVPGSPQMLKLNTPLFLGGFKLWYMVNRDSGILDGLDGAFQRLMVNRRSYNRLPDSAIKLGKVSLYRGPPCSPNPCYNAATCVPLLNDFYCKCSYMFVGKLCDQAIVNVNLDQALYFDGSTSLLYPGQLLRAQRSLNGIIEISFRAENGDGLLLWAGENDDDRAHTDYMALTLVGGLPQLTINLELSKESLILTSNSRVNDGSWHVIRITHRGHRAFLNVDDHPPIKGHIPQGHSTLHTDGNVWLGSYVAIPSHLGLSYHTGFHGCVYRLIINEREIQLVHHSASIHFQFCQVPT